MLKLPIPPCQCEFTPMVHAGLGGFPYQKKIESVGRGYHRRIRNLIRGRAVSQDSVTEFNAKKAARQVEEEALEKYRKGIKGKNFLSLTMYQQLGLGDVGFDASESQIRKAYHRVLIEHHPDKTGKTENDPNYLAVQKAFNTLIDPIKRRAYDSQCDFDESIPSGSEKIRQNRSDNTGICFYDLYGPVFTRNARFSENQPVPDIGNDSTDLDTVYSFYDFWHKFDSWRDFSHDAEHDIDSAGHRDEKRWMMKKNEAASKKKKKKEYARLASLVDRAMANDPRIKRAKQAEKDAKIRAKLEKEAAEEAARKAVEDAKAEEARKLAEEEASRKEAAKVAKIARDKQKKLLRKAKKLFRELMAKAREESYTKALDVEDTEQLCDSLDIDTLSTLSNALGGSADTLNVSGLEVVEKVLIEQCGEDFVRSKVVKRIQDQKRQNSTELQEPKSNSRPWTVEELSFLAKLSVKYPGGTRNRWDTISAQMNQHFSLIFVRTKEECVLKAKELVQTPQNRICTESGDSNQRSSGWTSAQQSSFEYALKQYPSTMEKNERWRLIASRVDGKTKKECVQRFKEIRKTLLK